MFKSFKYLNINSYLNNFNIFFLFKNALGFGYFFFKLVFILGGISPVNTCNLNFFSVFVKRCINTFACFYENSFTKPLFLEIEDSLLSLRKLNILRNFLFKNFLPNNGQRTKTNAKTSKRERIKY